MPPELPFVPTYTPLERLPVVRPCRRLTRLKQLCGGKNVLDLGAMDETAYLSKRGRGGWLHEELASVSKRVIGIDSSALIPETGLLTASNALILRGDIMALPTYLGAIQNERDFDPDIVVAGELIEHLPNPLQFLQTIRQCPDLVGKQLVLTTPNATALHNCVIALAKRESTHHDHLCILSYKTLCTLLKRAGYANWEITPYFAEFPEMKQRQGRLGRMVIAAGEAGVNLGEWQFPLLSFGFVVTTTI